MKCKKKIFMGIATLLLCFLLLPVNVLADEPSGGDTIVPGNYSLSGETIMYNGLETCLNGNLVYSNDHNTCLGSREAIIAYINSLNVENTPPVLTVGSVTDKVVPSDIYFDYKNKFSNGYALLLLMVRRNRLIRRITFYESAIWAWINMLFQQPMYLDPFMELLNQQSMVKHIIGEMQ